MRSITRLFRPAPTKGTSYDATPNRTAFLLTKPRSTSRNRTDILSLSEWQIICIITRTFLRRGGCRNWRLLRCRLLCNLLTRTSYIVCRYLVVPFSLILIGINVEMYDNFFILFERELLDSILTEHSKHHVLRILTWNFQNVISRHPRIASALRNAIFRFKRMSHKSCYFHVVYLYSLMIDGMLLMRFTCSLRYFTPSSVRSMSNFCISTSAGMRNTFICFDFDVRGS